jgi:hypothetical protein
VSPASKYPEQIPREAAPPKTAAPHLDSRFHVKDGHSRGFLLAILIGVMFYTSSALSPAIAGSWNVTYVYSGQITKNTQVTHNQPVAWLPNGSNINGGIQSTQTLTVQSQGSVTATLTWVPNPNIQLDPPPAVIMVKETSSANWHGFETGNTGNDRPWSFSGTVDNGLGSPTERTFDEVGDDAICAGVRVKKMNVPAPVNGVVSITLPAVSLNAQISGSTTVPSIKGNVTLIYSVTTITPHEHPTNMQELTPAGVQDNPIATINVNYKWDDTSGKTYSDYVADHSVFADMSSSEIREYVTYSGAGTLVKDPITGLFGFKLNSPPWPAITFNSPTTYANKSAASPPLADGHSTGASNTFVMPFSASTVTGAQYYRFHCSTCMQDGEWQTLRGPLPIVRNIWFSALFNKWKQTITAEGYTATQDLN